MDRRDCLKGMAAITAFHALRSAHAASMNGRAVEIAVDPRRAGKSISPRFMGLGYEISSVALETFLHPENHSYAQMVRTLSPQGVIRVGGNTSDYAAWSRDGAAVSAPKATIVNRASIQNLAEFLRATGWTLIWGLNLGQDREDEAVEEARAIAAIVGVGSVMFEVGNEPDLFVHAHRAAGYDYEQWREQYQDYAGRIARVVPGAVFAGPDVAVHTDWVGKFAQHAAKNMKLLTHHYYAEGPPKNPASTIENLLKPDPKLTRMLAQMRETSHTSGLPFRICETNSCFGGGKPGVSDTFASALWGLDYMFTLAEAEAEGLNMETGVNQLGFVSSYSPIVAREDGGYTARPLYYGMLAFAQSGHGRVLPLDYDAGALKMKAHAVLADNHTLDLTLINQDATQDIGVRMITPGEFRSARVSALTAPSLESKTGVALAQATVSSNGSWSPGKSGMQPVRDGKLEIVVPAASALIIRISETRKAHHYQPANLR
jgi:hypothetical protein